MPDPDYEAIERKVEEDMVRTELKPTPGVGGCANIMEP